MVQGIAGVLAVVVFGILWQLFAFRSDVAAGFASVTATLNAVDNRLGAVEARIDRAAQPEAVERRPAPS